MSEEENRFEEAAIEAEFETGYREETREEARRGVITRLLRMTAGTLVTIIGVIMMPLPGPGLLIVAVGLGILSRDVAWADRLLQIVRRRLPSDSDGRLPRSSIITMVVLALAGIAFSLWVAFFR
ncbi:MAG: PGPGW domain-containing protein [Actinomycetota bacterium]|nr:PGPGW domain-containing protein [Actinomycetota bacterium]MEC9473406.1 PGPGW domain-containing protein [Actinomycetota bacterium]MEE3255760.1 PGPGW domain-containing protein [Actinomycetota bacterium]